MRLIRACIRMYVKLSRFAKTVLNAQYKIYDFTTTIDSYITLWLVSGALSGLVVFKWFWWA